MEELTISTEATPKSFRIFKESFEIFDDAFNKISPVSLSTISFANIVPSRKSLFTTKYFESLALDKFSFLNFVFFLHIISSLSTQIKS